jgi:protein-S-isoprenylcysteine O-methyltransferase Ste14
MRKHNKSSCWVQGRPSRTGFIRPRAAGQELSLAAGGSMMDWKLKLGNFLFKHRSFTPLPIIILVFIIFKPLDLGSHNWIINISGLLLSFIGETVRIMAVGFSFEGTSGRESYLRAENLNVSGIYSLVRNPLYIGNFFMFAGIVAVFANGFAFLVFAFFLIGQYYFVILAEENYLQQQYSEQYSEYCQRVRRIIPIFKKYKKNQNPFNLKKVIFKENDSVFNLLVMFLVVLLYKENYFNGSIAHPEYYIIPGAFLIVLYIIVKIFKKRS